MSVQILKNVVFEGPGTIARFLDDRATVYNVVEPDAVGGASLDGASALVVMGGPMGVYEAHEHPQLRAGMALMEGALKGGLPVLGVCLGCQMLAQVLGARVYKGTQGQEVGWHDITLTEEGLNDPALGAYAAGSLKHRVFHLHGDTFDIPAGAVRLAGSAMYEAQAFRYAESAYGLQFHIEVTPQIVADWMAGQAVPGEPPEDMDEFYASAEMFYECLFNQK